MISGPILLKNELNLKCLRRFVLEDSGINSLLFLQNSKLERIVILRTKIDYFPNLVHLKQFCFSEIEIKFGFPLPKKSIFKYVDGTSDSAENAYFHSYFNGLEKVSENLLQLMENAGELKELEKGEILVQ